MSDTTAAPLTPSRMRSILTLMMAVAAALLYAAILGAGILRTLTTEGTPSFPSGMERLASALCGLMGTIVTAGFARGGRATSTPITAPHPMGGDAPTGWYSLRPPSRARSKFGALGHLLGVSGWRVRQAPSPSDTDAPTPEPTPPAEDTAPLWAGVLYAAVYVLVGLAAAVTVVAKSATVPPMVDNAAMVFGGTMI